MEPDESPAGLLLARWKLVYVPVPKAACTSTLWALADLVDAGAATTAVAGSAAVTRALMVHEPAFWSQAPSSSLMTHPQWSARAARDDWLIFTIVRHPVRRLWSAWHSKLLLREPVFAARYGAERWFPRIPHRAAEVAEDFRAFVDALARDAGLLAADRHWRPQVELVAPERVAYTHVGRTEVYADTLAVLDAHLRARGSAAAVAPRHDNATLLRPADVGAIDGTTRAAIEALYGADMTAFGYASPAQDGARRAGEQLERLLGGVRAIIARHERIGDLLASQGRAVS